MSNDSKNNNKKDKNIDKLKSLNDEDIKELMKNRSYKKVRGKIHQTPY